MIRVPSKGPVPARWMLVGEAPGVDEEQWTTNGRFDPQPFVGVSGRLLDGVLEQVMLPRANAFVTNVVKYRPPGNKIEEWLTDNKKRAEKNELKHLTNGLYHNDQVKEGVEELLHEIEIVKPEVIVVLGNTPLWALTGQTGITKWRGSELWYGDARLIPVVHPASILRVMDQKWLMVHDFKHRVMGKMAHPELGREPNWRFSLGKSFADAAKTLDYIRLNVESGDMPSLSVDIETKKGRIDTVGFAWSNRDAFSLPVISTANNGWWSEGEWRELSDLTRRILTNRKVSIIGQNFNYDAQYFERDPAFGFRVVCRHDTKVAQHLLLPGTDKDLVTLSSIYCDWHCYWKDDLKESAATLNDDQRLAYNCRDCVVTYEVAAGQVPELRKLGFM